MKRQKLKLLILPLIVVFFLSAGFYHISAQVSDTSVLSMSGNGWSLKVDGQVQTAEVKSAPTVSIAKDASGAKELSLVLNSLDECKAGVVQFKVDTVGLTCYKQLPLTEEEVKQGAVRPENVVNSYACFDSSGRKVLHIYASRLIDAKNNSVWVDQTLKDGLLTVELNETWLQTAVFPCILDPVFGYTSIGGSNKASYNNFLRMFKFSVAEAGTATKISVYTQYGVSCKAALYDDNGGSPDALVAEGSEVTAVAGWTNFTINYAFVAGDYWIAFGSTSDANLYYDSGGTAGFVSYTYPTFPDPAGSYTSENNQYSAFVTYTTGGGSPQDLALTINDPDNTTYTTGTIPINLTVANNESALQWNIWNTTSGSAVQVYGSNHTLSSESLTGFVNGTYMFGCFAENTTASLYSNVNFSVAIPPAATPTPAPTATPASGTSSIGHEWILFALMALGIGLAVYPRIPLVNFIYGAGCLSITALAISDTAIAFSPYLQVIFGFVAVLVMASGGLSFMRNR